MRLPEKKGGGKREKRALYRYMKNIEAVQLDQLPHAQHCLHTQNRAVARNTSRPLKHAAVTQVLSCSSYMLDTQQRAAGLQRGSALSAATSLNLKHLLSASSHNNTVQWQRVLRMIVVYNVMESDVASFAQEWGYCTIL